ncbi:hypothetical protein VTL71DRAFT_10922 [Oculimacula yallundae]|uniref:Uncharacterized protein n=1 Tax=Oculimacula yallundae TaxID=86028 RepID=A0ABR4CVV6_9HELO
MLVLVYKPTSPPSIFQYPFVHLDPTVSSDFYRTSNFPTSYHTDSLKLPCAETHTNPTPAGATLLLGTSPAPNKDVQVTTPRITTHPWAALVPDIVVGISSLLSCRMVVRYFRSGLAHKIWTPVLRLTFRSCLTVEE